jgi:hypothetical protein
MAGAGTIVPITGFANSVVSPAIEFKAEGFVTGMAAKMFTIAGPVIVYGTLASVCTGSSTGSQKSCERCSAVPKTARVNSPRVRSGPIT